MRPFNFNLKNFAKLSAKYKDLNLKDFVPIEINSNEQKF